MARTIYGGTSADATAPGGRIVPGATNVTIVYDFTYEAA